MFKYKHTFLLLYLLLSVTCTQAQVRGSYLQLGRYELSKNHFPEAIDKLNTAIQVDPDLYEGYFLRGFAKYQLDDFKGADDDYSKAISIYSDLEELFFYRALVREKLFNYEGAFQDYDKAIKLDSTDARIYANRSISFLSINQFQASLDDCNHALRLRSTEENLYIVRGAAKAGLLHYREAIDDFNKVLKKNPKNAFARIQRGISYGLFAKKDSAMTDYNFVIAMDSTNGPALFQRGLLYMENSKYKDALRDFNTIIRISPYNASAYFNRAIVKSDMNNFKDALVDYDKVLTLNPNNIEAYYNRGGVKYKLGIKKEALKDYDKAIELFPAFADAYYNRSLIKKELGNISGSMTDYKKSEALKKSTTSQKDSTNFSDGIRLMKLTNLNSDFESKDDPIQKVQYNHIEIQPQPMFMITLFPDDNRKVKLYDTRKKLHYYGDVLALINGPAVPDKNKILKKITALDSVIAKSPAKPAAYIDRAVMYGELNNYTDAFTDLNKAIALDSNDISAYFCRANARFKVMEQTGSFSTDTLQISIKGTPQNYEPQKNGGNHYYDQIIDDYNKVLKLDPKFTYALFNRSSVRVLEDDYKGAINDLTVAVIDDPNFSEAFYNRGLLLIFQKENDLGCADLSKAGELGMVDAYNVMKRYCNK